MEAFQPFGVAAVNNSIMTKVLRWAQHDTLGEAQAPRNVATGE
jgi:hypothetical protein